jgi:hypothetical protein
MDILDQMEAWRKNARFMSEQDFFSRMMFEIITNRNEIERLRDALEDLMAVQNGPPLATYTDAWNAAMKKADAALKEKE